MSEEKGMERVVSIDRATVQMIEKSRQDGVQTAPASKSENSMRIGFAGVCCRICTPA